MDKANDFRKLIRVTRAPGQGRCMLLIVAKLKLVHVSQLFVFNFKFIDLLDKSFIFVCKLIQMPFFLIKLDIDTLYVKLELLL
jgi:hypothetical protein